MAYAGHVITPQRRKILHTFVFDVSGSMQIPLKLRATAQQSGKTTGELDPRRVQTVFDVICRLAEDGISLAKDQDIYVAALCFGLRDVDTCDLLAFLEQRTKVLTLLDEAEDHSLSELLRDEALTLLTQHGLDENYLVSVGRSISIKEDLYKVVGREPLIALLASAGAPYCEDYVHDLLSPDAAGKYFVAFAKEDRAPQLRMIVDQLPLACKDYIAHVAESRTLGKAGGIGHGLRRSSSVETTRLADQLIAGSGKSATRDQFQILLKSIQDPTPKSLEGVVQLVRKLKTALGQSTSLDNGVYGVQESDPSSIDWERLLDNVEPYLYGATPMCEALRRVHSGFRDQTYVSKVMILISDGEATDGDPVPLAKALREADGIISTCLITGSGSVPRRFSNPFRTKNIPILSRHWQVKDDTVAEEEPRRLRGPKEMDPNWSEAARVMFKMASTVSYDSAPVQALRRRGWVLPASGLCKLFVLANSHLIIDEFTTASRQLSTSWDILADMIGQISLDSYIQRSNDCASVTDQEQRSICWAHAVATVFHLASSRVVGRDVPDFFQIRSHLLTKFEDAPDGQSVCAVLTETCSRYKLRWRECDEAGARSAIYARRPVITTFWLDGNRWSQFSAFYRRSPTGTLTAQAMKAAVGGKPGGHAAVLIRCNETSLTIMNSWGVGFAHDGFFTIDKPSTLEVVGGPCMRFYDVYWTTDDLSASELAAWRDHEIKTGQNMLSALPTSFRDLPVDCPHCKNSAAAREYDGSWYEVRCRACQVTFKPTAKALLQSLYDGSYS